VAIKKVRQGNARDGVSVPALREIKILQELAHPNVIQVLVSKSFLTTAHSNLLS
jgi:hypothetical protein